MAININELAYPFDPTGKLASNKIVGEQHILTAINWRDYNFILLRNGPFFGDVKLTFRGLDNVSKALELGKDYYLTHLFHDASLACASPIYGSISFNDTQLVGVVTVESYQTLGGIWTLDDAKIAEILAESLHNPRITTWEQIVDMPISFPVIDHEWNLIDMVGMKEVEAALWGIEAALRASSQQGLTEHLNDFSNPHRVTKEQVALGLVRNLMTATAAQAIAGASDDLYLTPFGLRAALNAGPFADILAHINDHNNPHGVTAEQLGVMTRAEVMNELNGKLGRYETAADTRLLAGRTDVAFKAWVLEGTAANSLKFGGYTTSEFVDMVKAQIGVIDAYTKAQTDYLLSLKLDKTGKAADSFRLDGRDSNTLKEWILQGTAANSISFNGMTQPQYTQYILDLVRNGTVGNTYTKPEIDYFLSQKLDLLGTAINSTRFGGRDSDTYKAWVLEGTVANALHFDGRTFAQAKAEILLGTAYNADRFNNMTFPQLQAYFDGLYGNSNSLIVFPAQAGAAGDIWVKVAEIDIPANSSVFDATAGDCHFLIAGGDTYNNVAGSPVQTVRVNVRGPTAAPISVQVTSTSDITGNLQIGFNIDADKTTGGLWVRSPRNRNSFAITQLCESDAVKIAVTDPILGPPAGITYVTVTGGGTYATKEDLEAVLEVMTQSFNQLAASLA